MELGRMPGLLVVRYVLEQLEKQAIRAGSHPVLIHEGLDAFDRIEVELVELRAQKAAAYLDLAKRAEVVWRGESARADALERRLIDRERETDALIKTAEAEVSRLREALLSDAVFLRWYLEKLEHRTVTTIGGPVVNGYAFAEVPDWEMRQRLADVEAALVPSGSAIK